MSRADCPPLTDAPVAATDRTTVLEEQTDPLLAGLDRPRQVLVAGASGFVGRHLLQRLASRGHRVRAFDRSGRGGRELPALATEWRTADVRVAEELRGIAEGCDVVVHLVGGEARPEGEDAGLPPDGTLDGSGTDNLIREAERADVGKFILVSALGAGPSGSAFYRHKYAAEERLRRSSLRETVAFRPAIIYGPHDHFTTYVARLLRRLPVFPVLGDGSFRLQPVAIEDVADALCQAVERDDLGDAAYVLAGPERITFRRILRILARAVGLRRPIVRVPARLGRSVTWLAWRLGFPRPLTPAQLSRLREGSAFGGLENSIRRVFQLEPLPFRVALRDYLG